MGLSREMENISRGSTFADFVTILTERSMQDVTFERSRVILQPLPLQEKLHSVAVYIYSRLNTVQFLNNNDPCRHNKGSVSFHMELFHIERGFYSRTEIGERKIEGKTVHIMNAVGTGQV
jgi:hypothetical protein